MHRKVLEPLIGKIVCVDLVNRERPVCRLTEITEDGIATLKDPLIFMPTPVGPSNYQVTAIPYAAPLYEVKKLKVSIDHIVSILDVPSQMEQAYIKHTSGLVTDTAPKIIVP